MGCCRGRKISTKQSADCKTLEGSGARTIVQVLSTAQGPRLVVATSRNGYLDLGSFLNAFKCNGATANLLRRYLPTIQQALQLDPAAFTAQRSGIDLTNLVRVAERVTKRRADVQTQSKVPFIPSG